jgi:hypothetical protein
MFPYNLPHFLWLLQKFFQTWISKRIYEKNKKKNKLEKKKVDLFLEI